MEKKTKDLLATKPSAKELAILAATLKLCRQYGLKKTSMDDIAKQTGMSRPSLYNYYPNKAAIVRSAAAHLHQKALRGVDEALKLEGAPEFVLGEALLAWGADFVDLLYNSPHGPEIIGNSGQATTDISTQSRARCISLLASYLEQAHQKRDISLEKTGLSADNMARLLLLSFQGVQAGHNNISDYKKALAELLRVFSAAMNLGDTTCKNLS